MKPLCLTAACCLLISPSPAGAHQSGALVDKINPFIGASTSTDLGEGKPFTVRARENSAENDYIQSAKLSGKLLGRAWLRHGEVVAGGTLDLLWAPKPNQAWGSSPDVLPPRNFPPHN